jgi:hypothetical protein
MKLKALLGFLLCFICMSLYAQQLHYTSKDVEAAITAKNFPQADAELRSIIAEKPDLAGPHWVLAQVLYHEETPTTTTLQLQQLLGESQDQLTEAEHADPTYKTHWAAPGEVSTFQQKLTDKLNEVHYRSAVVTRPLAAARTMVATPVVVHHGADPLVTFFYVFGGILLIALIVALFIRLIDRDEPKTIVIQTPAPVGSSPTPAPAPTAYVGQSAQMGSNYAFGQRSPVPSSVVQPAVSRPYASASTMSSGPVVQQGHSTGAMVGAGLAGVAAGVVADELWHEHERAQDIIQRDELAQQGGGNDFDQPIGQQEYQQMQDDPISMGDTSGWSGNDPEPDTIDTSSLDDNSFSGGDSGGGDSGW